VLKLQACIFAPKTGMEFLSLKSSVQGKGIRCHKWRVRSNGLNGPICLAVTCCLAMNTKEGMTFPSDQALTKSHPGLIVSLNLR
jgi:hypothetical protein